MGTTVKKMYDGTFRLYNASTGVVESTFILRGFPTVSSLEKIRYNMDVIDGYVTLELRMYEIEVPA